MNFLNTKSITNKELFYINNQNHIKIDKTNGYFSCINRAVYSLVGFKNYKICDILKTASNFQSVKSLDPHQVHYIYAKAGQKLQVKAEIINRLFDCIVNFHNNQAYADIFHQLTNDLKDRSQLNNLENFKKHLDPQSEAHQIVSKAIQEAQLKIKLEAIKLDPHLVDEHRDDIEFLIKTRLIYSIIGYQNTTEAGKTDHALKIDYIEDEKLCLWIKKEGQWTPVKKIKEEFTWDKVEGVLANKTNPNERWNYFHEGLVPIDRFCHHEAMDSPNYPQQNIHLKPVAKLSEKEMRVLLNHAMSFGRNKENLNSIQKDCVIQVFSNPRPISENNWLKNLNAQIPVHCAIRIITKEGDVYSTGFGSTLLEDKYNNKLNKYLGTINGQPTIFDYEEFRPHDGRIVTSIPVSSDQAQEILNNLNIYRERTIRFNIVKQNCMKLGTSILSLAGIDLNIRISSGTMLYRALPDLQLVPLIGKPLSSLVGRVNEVNHTIHSSMPSSMKKAFEALNQIVFFVPNKIGALLKNLLALSLGGHIGSPERKNETEAYGKCKMDWHDNEEDMDSLDSFSHLVQNLFDNKVSDIQHSAVFINWQLKKQSTTVHLYSGQPNMNIMPPQTDLEQAQSEKRKEEFKDIFKYSVPVFN